MPLSYPAIVLLLIALMVGSLLLVHLLQGRQEQDVIRLYRLAALDKRRSALSKIIKGLKAIDDSTDVTRLLTQTLKHDLQRIHQLDPARGNGEQELRALGGDAAKADKNADAAKSSVDRKTSLSSEREVLSARSLINDALTLIRHLYQMRQVTGDQLESTARHLGMLSARVGVNSNMHMADLAMAQGDARRALGHYRAAESYLLSGPLKGAEGEQKLQYIQQRREQILQQHTGSDEQEGFMSRAA
ncbi:MAG: hypothetical protein KDI28_07020 [Pseudomonadales bacterium]|nr:hypothetical protein [Pseudomonadales bacterium]MCP5356893.1 hypothetical protein [Pseudomonadales bacterium]